MRKLVKLALAAWIAAVAGPAMAQKTLTIGVAGFPDSLKTGWSSFTALTLSIQTNDVLLSRSNEGQPVPSLAERWQAVDDLTWRFFLRKGVTFSDGKPFTAADVKFTLDYVLDPNTKYGTASRINQIRSVAVVDDHTVEIKTKVPFPTLLIGLTNIVIEPKHYHEQVGAEGMLRRPMGTGPFVFERWLPADRYELRANPNYWGGKPKLDRLVFRQIPEGATRVASLLAGETHIIEEIPVDLAPRVKSSRNVELAAVATSGSFVLTFETRKPPFDNPKLRLAADLAIDKELINRQILDSTGEVLDNYVTKTTFGYNPAVKRRKHDPEAAKRLVAEAGYPNGLSAQIVTRSGRYVSDVEITNAVAGMLSKVGINASVSVVEGGVYSRMAAASDMGPMHVVGWYSLGDADFNTVWFADVGKRNFWSHPEYEKLFVEARSTVDQAKRLKAYHRMMEIMHQENPAVFLFGVPSIYGVSKRLKGFTAPSDRVMIVAGADLN